MDADVTMPFVWASTIPWLRLELNPSSSAVTISHLIASSPAGLYHRVMTLVEPSAPDPTWPRYSTIAFPAYRFVGGLNPHPRRDPRGHAYGIPEVPPPRVPPERWRGNDVYLHGIDLYNFAYWWECHEALEGLWHLTGHQGTEAQFLQGIIQVAAANLRRHVGSPIGARRLGGEAVGRLESVGRPQYMGLTIAPFVAAVRARHLEESTDAIPMLRLEV
jgi:hypothetical protein